MGAGPGPDVPPGAWSADQVLTGEELREIILAVHPLEEAPREPHATARVFRFADGQGEIGFINPVSEPFCADCNRIRLTADGKLRTCLFSIHETDLRAPLRSGASDAEIEQVIRDAVWRKELKHRVGEPEPDPVKRCITTEACSLGSKDPAALGETRNGGRVQQGAAIGTG